MRRIIIITSLIVIGLIANVLPQAFGREFTKNGNEYYIYGYESDSQGLDINGKTVIPKSAGYESIGIIGDDDYWRGRYDRIDGDFYLYGCMSNGEKHLFDKRGKRINIPAFTKVSPFYVGPQQLLYLSHSQNQHSLYSLDGKCVIPKFTGYGINDQCTKQFTYGNIKYYAIYLMIDARQNMRAGLIDENLNIIIPAFDSSYNSFERFTDRWIWCHRFGKGKSDYFDLATNKVIDLPYAKVQPCNEIIMKVMSDKGNYGLYDIDSNQELLAPDFDDVDYIDGTDLIKYKLNGYWGVMNRSGKEIIPSSRGYTDIKYVNALKKFAYTANGYKGECNAAGVQTSKIKTSNPSTASTPSKPTSTKSTTATKTSTVSNTSSSNTSSSSSQNQGHQVKEYTETVPVQVWQACGGCNGTGQCHICYGSGWTLNYKSEKQRCNTCHGTGKCTGCAGNGGQNVVRYEQRTVYR